MKTKIAASILSADPLHLGRDLTALKNAGVPMLHVDVMDGHYVPNLSIGLHTIDAIAKNSGLPLDVHLMTERPGDFLPRLRGICKMITVTYEVLTHPIKLLRDIRDMGSLCGVAVEPGTDAGILRPILPHLDYVLCMTVETGFAGQSFISSALDNLDVLRALRKEMGLQFFLQVDGSIGAQNVALCAEHGAEWCVVGANMFPKDGRSIDEAYKEITGALQTNM
jgi:ribulose-phosphate 3-epimerase